MLARVVGSGVFEMIARVGWEEGGEGVCEGGEEGGDCGGGAGGGRGGGGGGEVGVMEAGEVGD